MQGMPITVNSTVSTSPFLPRRIIARSAVHRVDGRIGKRLGVEPRRLLGVAVVPKANRVLGWLVHVTLHRGALPAPKQERDPPITIEPMPTRTGTLTVSLSLIELDRAHLYVIGFPS